MHQTFDIDDGEGDVGLDASGALRSGGLGGMLRAGRNNSAPVDGQDADDDDGVGTGVVQVDEERANDGDNDDSILDQNMNSNMVRQS